MAKQQINIVEINIVDFDLFYEVLKTASKVMKSMKMIINSGGIEIYGTTPERIVRAELTSNSVTSADQVEVAIEDIQKFNKIVGTVIDVHAGDYSNLKFFVDMPSIKFESKKFKTKYSTIDPAVISDWITNKFKTELTPVFEFTTTNDLIKRLANHSFMFTVPKDVRVHIATHAEMENNVVYGTLTNGNTGSTLGNEITLKLGLATFGTLTDQDTNETRSLIIDLPRLTTIGIMPTSDIHVSVSSINVIKASTKMSGKNGTFFNLSIYTGLLKS